MRFCCCCCCCYCCCCCCLCRSSLDNSAVAGAVAVVVVVVAVAVVVAATQVVVALVVAPTNNSNNVNSVTLMNDTILLTYSFTSVRVRYVLSKNETNRFKILRDFFMIAILLFIVVIHSTQYQQLWTTTTYSKSI